MKKTILALAAAAVTFTGLATAADANPLNQRETRIEKRIDQGARTGQLSRGEAAKLRMRLTRVERVQRIQRIQRHRGMRMTQRQKLNHRLDKLSTRVRFEKHRRG